MSDNSKRHVSNSFVKTIRLSLQELDITPPESVNTTVEPLLVKSDNDTRLSCIPGTTKASSSPSLAFADTFPLAPPP